MRVGWKVLEEKGKAIPGEVNREQDPFDTKSK